jgi:hypothetical protein
MIELKQQDLLIGVKADQSLRDVLRDALDGEQRGAEGLELAPVGRKTWVAGRRIGPVEDLARIAEAAEDVHRRLLALGSAQRIRQENIRVWVAAPPVPVFRDPEPRDAEPRGGEGPVTCPVCGREVHSYNLHRDSAGRAVGCYMCGGNPGGFRS